VKRGRKVGGDDVVPFLRREVLDRRDELYARVIDEYVDAAEARLTASSTIAAISSG
jgi:hypothetical protein